MDENAFAGISSRRRFEPCLDIATKRIRGDVVYLGDKDDKSYFRMGKLFWSYYKLRACRMILPRTFALGGGLPYVVTFENMPGGGGPSCPRKADSDQH